MMKRIAGISACLGLLVAVAAWGQAVKQIVRVEGAGQNRLLDANWRPMGNAVRDGEMLVCGNGADAARASSFSQTITLNQRSPLPIVARVWSKAEDIGGVRDNDYSLYLDLQYMDGEPLWGQTAPFRVGSHDWERGEVKIFPAKPVRSVAVHLLMRRHAGRAAFRGAELFEVKVDGDVAMFDGLPVIASKKPEGGFAVRDVAADGNFIAFREGAALDLRLQTLERKAGDATHISGSITSTTAEDRAITLVYTMPLAGRGWHWLAGPRKRELAEGARDYVAGIRTAGGAHGLMSRYPFAAVAKEGDGRAIVLDMTRPALFRAGYSAGTGELYIAYDLALTKEKPSADFAFWLFPFKGEDGFRGAVEGMYTHCADQFQRRVKKQGVWMPFHSIRKVQGWEDFGFAYKEGADETAWDDAHDILTFRYTEPMTWWMAMPKGTPRTMESAIAEAHRRVDKGERAAQVLFTSGHHDEEGRLIARLRNEPWCDGAVWSMNSAPGISGLATDFSSKWNAQLREKLYGAGRKGDLDGEYIDSAEGYVTAELDYRREHFSAMKTPLTFSTDNKRPAILRGLIAYEYIRGIADDVHGMGKLMMANGVPQATCWLAPLVDVMGTETDWNGGGKWRPMSDEELLYRRVMCGTKPFCFLMNTDFDRFGRDRVEKFMKRCLAYGMFPGFFSHNAAEGHYFSRPELYNRDRDLFRRYVPLCQRVSEAGWRPVTGAASSDGRVHVERFGERYLTVFNDGEERRSATITFAGPSPAKCRELLTGREVALSAGALRLELGGEDVMVLEME